MKSTKNKQIVSPHTGEVFSNGKFRTPEQVNKIREYRRKFVKDNYRTFVLKINRIGDADIVCFLQGQDNLSSFVRGLVREYMEKINYEYNPEQDPECMLRDSKDNPIGLDEEKIEAIRIAMAERKEFADEK